MSNKERGLHGNCYCTFDLRVRWLRWACRRDGDSMNVGDLVKARLGFRTLGIVIKVVVDDPINPERNTMRVQWNDGYRESLNASRLEVLNESR